MKNSPLMLATSFAPASGEVVISKSSAMENATDEERDNAIADLFMGLAVAITNHGCRVDLSDPKNIRVTKK